MPKITWGEGDGKADCFEQQHNASFVFHLTRLNLHPYPTRLELEGGGIFFRVASPCLVVVHTFESLSVFLRPRLSRSSLLLPPHPFPPSSAPSSDLRTETCPFLVLKARGRERHLPISWPILCLSVSNALCERNTWASPREERQRRRGHRPPEGKRFFTKNTTFLICNNLGSPVHSRDNIYHPPKEQQFRSLSLASLLFLPLFRFLTSVRSSSPPLPLLTTEDHLISCSSPPVTRRCRCWLLLVAAVSTASYRQPYLPSCSFSHIMATSIFEHKVIEIDGHCLLGFC